MNISENLGNDAHCKVIHNYWAKLKFKLHVCFYHCICVEITQGDSSTFLLLFTASDCFEIGKLSYNKKDYYHALMWLLQALYAYEAGDVNGVDKFLLLDFLVYTADEVDRSKLLNVNPAFFVHLHVS